MLCVTEFFWLLRPLVLTKVSLMRVPVLPKTPVTPRSTLKVMGLRPKPPFEKPNNPSPVTLVFPKTLVTSESSQADKWRQDSRKRRASPRHVF